MLRNSLLCIGTNGEGCLTRALLIRSCCIRWHRFSVFDRHKNAVWQLVTLKSHRKGHLVLKTLCFMLPVWYNDPQSLNCPLWHHLLYMDSFKCVHYFAFGTSYACWHWFSPRTDVIGSTLRFAEKVDVYIIVPVVCAVCRRCTVEVKTVTFWHGSLSSVPQMWRKTQTMK